LERDGVGKLSQAQFDTLLAVATGALAVEKIDIECAHIPSDLRALKKARDAARLVLSETLSQVSSASTIDMIDFLKSQNR
jgi:hypothetical protein